MQSRGAVFGVTGAILVMFLLQKSSWKLGVAGALICALLLALYNPTTIRDVSDNIVVYLERGESADGLYTMSGRTNHWDAGWEAFKDAPILGKGQWADRLSGLSHIHNTYLQALLIGGSVGFVPFCLSWIMGWRLFLRLWRCRDRLEAQDRWALQECALVMTFFC
jgi:O-Antigen ligase.